MIEYRKINHSGFAEWTLFNAAFDELDDIPKYVTEYIGTVLLRAYACCSQSLSELLFLSLR